jgi:hypothetical protein
MPIYHRVKMGETLASIAKQYGLKPYQLMNYNPQAKFISAGMSLAIPTQQKKSGTGTPPGYTPYVPWAINTTAWKNLPQNYMNTVAKKTSLAYNYPSTTQQASWGANVWNWLTSGKSPGGSAGVNNITQPVTQPAATQQTTQQQAGAYTPTGWNAIVNQPSPATQVSGQDLSGLSEKELNEYEGYLKWVMNNPERYARYQEAGYDMSYDAYLNSKYSGGGGDFWEYMQEHQMGQQKRVKRKKPKPAGQVGMGYKAYLKNIHGRGGGQTYEEVGVPQQYYSNYYSGYNNYYSPTSFGVVTWRGW